MATVETTRGLFQKLSRNLKGVAHWADSQLPSSSIDPVASSSTTSDGHQQSVLGDLASYTRHVSSTITTELLRAGDNPEALNTIVGQLGAGFSVANLAPIGIYVMNEADEKPYFTVDSKIVPDPDTRCFLAVAIETALETASTLNTRSLSS